MSTEEEESKTKSLDKKNRNTVLKMWLPQPINNSALNIRKKAMKVLSKVLSFLLPESTFNLWPSAGKKGAEEPWVPTDPNEIVNFPEKELASFDRIFPPDSKFIVLRFLHFITVTSMRISEWYMMDE
ncbi:unnamed protein product [Toxocara canis]|uniref:Uncharacterized protein n=1 Tax=Toxocara canis TaxID=6265 RepID=A0A183U6R8_TOXCA|nr:unnamed protein product [Toxocara canis]